MDIPEVNQLRSEVAALRRRVAELEAASASHRDVEVALGAARQRLYDVLETLPVYVILLSADYHVPFANRFFRERFGDAGDKRCYEYLFGYSEPCKNCETYRVMETQAPHRWEWVGPDTRTYDIYDYPFKDSDGSPLILEVGIDITERINAEAALRESNETLERRVAERTAELHREKLTSEKVIEVMPGVFYIFDAQGRLIKWNKNFERVSGYSAEELARMTLTDFFVDEDKRLIEQRGAEVFARGESWAEAEFVSKDGHKIPYYFTGLLVEMDGAPCLIGMGLDITERKRAEDVLREAKADLERRVEERTAELHAASLYARSLIEASLDPMVTISPQGKITDVNKATEEATGVPRERLIGSDFSDYFTEPDKAREGYQQVIARGLVRDYPLTMRHVSGHTMDVVYNAAVYRNEAGELQGVFAAARDITERKRAEEALRSVSLYTRSLIEASLDPMVTISPQGKITDVNKATEEATGVPRKRLIGSDFSDYFTEPDKAREGYQQVIARGLVRDYPLTMRHVSGHTMDVVYNAAVYRNEAGELQGVFAAARDITERKRAEEALQRQTKELERSNADLQQFAYVASHDLQEPLRIVAGFTQLLQQRYKGRLDSDADEFIAFAVDGANRMQRMINDLLAYSRVNTRNECFEAVALEDVLAQTLANLAMMIGENDAVVTHDPLPIVLANPTQMEHLLQNLVGNALKFRDDKPPRVHISAQAQGNEWVVSVQDNGMGIAPEYHDRIFAIFQRLHNRDAYPGNGIGLAVCKRIVERHGGRIWVESTPGKGSTFYFSIPREETANGHP